MANVKFRINNVEHTFPAGTTYKEAVEAVYRESEPEDDFEFKMEPAKLPTQTKPREEAGTDFLSQFAYGAGRNIRKSLAGLKEFASGKPSELLEPAPTGGYYGMLGRLTGEAIPHLAETYAGMRGGYALGKPFGLYGKIAGPLLGAFASQYLTQPGERLSRERAEAGLGGLSEALMLGTGGPEKRAIKKETAEIIGARPTEETLKTEAAQVEEAIEERKAAQRASAEQLGIQEPSSLEFQKKGKLEEIEALEQYTPYEGELSPLYEPESQQKEAVKNIQKIISPQPGESTNEKTLYDTITQSLNKKKEEMGKLYQDFRAENENKVIKLPTQQQQAEKIIEQMQKEPTFSELMGQGFESEDMAEKINKQIVPDYGKANTLFDNYRSLKKLSKRAYGKANALASELTEDQKAIYKNAGEKYNALAEQLAEIIENNGHGESLEKLKNINERFATEYAPIYNTNTFWYMHNKKIAPPNIIGNIEGETSGNQLFKNIIKGNEDAIEAALGQQIEKNPEAALSGNVGALLRPYIEKHSTLPEWYKKLQGAIESKPSASLEHEKLMKQARNLEILTNKNLTKYKTKEQVALRQEVLEKDIAKIDEFIQKINKAIQKEEAALATKTKTEQSIKEANKKLKELKARKDSLNIVQEGLLSQVPKYYRKIKSVMNKL